MHENATPDMFRAVYELWPDAINEKDKPQDHYRTGKPLHYFCKEGQMSSQTATELIKRLLLPRFCRTRRLRLRRARRRKRQAGEFPGAVI